MYRDILYKNIRNEFFLEKGLPLNRFILSYCHTIALGGYLKKTIICPFSIGDSNERRKKDSIFISITICSSYHCSTGFLSHTHNWVRLKFLILPHISKNKAGFSASEITINDYRLAEFDFSFGKTFCFQTYLHPSQGRSGG